MNPPQKDWQGKTVWLVGASTGIAAQLAHQLHSLGAHVVVSARQTVLLQEFVQTHSTGNGSSCYTLDVKQAHEVANAFAQISSQRAVDVVVYAAGIFQPMRAMNFDLAKMQEHQAINVGGFLNVLACIVPYFLNRCKNKLPHQNPQPHIAIIGSVAGYKGLPQGLAYGHTKAALSHLAENLYIDLRAHGIGVSLICPGFVATTLTANNPFPMPALVSVDCAADAILAGWRKGKFEIHFPKRFTWCMKLLQCLPHRVYFFAIARLTGL